MTSAQLNAASILIPAAYEPKPPRPDDPLTVLGPAATTDSYVVSAPYKPTSRLGFGAAVLGDLALCLALIYGVALGPGLVIHGITAAANLIFGNGH
jgi:hypothetical protein